MVPQKSFLALFAAAQLGASYTFDSQKIWPNAVVRLNIKGPPPPVNLQNAIRVFELITCVRFFPQDVAGSDKVPLRRGTARDLVGTPRGPVNIEFKNVKGQCKYDGKSTISLFPCTDEELYVVLAAVVGIKEALDPKISFDTSIIDLVNRIYDCDRERYSGAKTRMPTYTVSNPNPNPDKSSYTFALDDTSVQYMERLGSPKYIGVLQHCYGKGTFSNYQTSNFGVVEYKKAQTNYTVEANRCKKEHSRVAGSYQGLFCPTDKEGDCKTKCVDRLLDNRQLVKGVQVNDPLLWVCHEPVIPP